MMSALLALRIAVVAAIVAEHLVLAKWVGPDFEAAHAPVLRRQSIDGVDRLEGGRRLCWTWRFDKGRRARAVDAGWTLRTDDEVYPFQRVETVADSGGSGAALQPRPVRPRQWTRKCIEVPENLVGRPFRLTGFVEYRTALTGALWSLRQETPEVDQP